MKRVFDFFVSCIVLVLASPVLLPVMFLVWLQDFHSPFYIAERVGLRGQTFKMFKLRSMVVGADKTGVASTSNNDRRISKVGHFIRRYKLDELTQLINVFLGDMSLVGPRPNLQWAVDGYTPLEKKLIEVRPGITDLASIVFADEGHILKDSIDPDRDYDLLIRPWKSRLALLSIEHQGFLFDFRILILTALTIFSRQRALIGVEDLLKKINAPEEVIRVSRRQDELVPHFPPGSLHAKT